MILLASSGYFFRHLGNNNKILDELFLLLMRSVVFKNKNFDDDIDSHEENINPKEKIFQKIMQKLTSLLDETKETIIEDKIKYFVVSDDLN